MMTPESFCIFATIWGAINTERRSLRNYSFTVGVARFACTLHSEFFQQVQLLKTYVLQVWMDGGCAMPFHEYMFHLPVVWPTMREGSCWSLACELRRSPPPSPRSLCHNRWIIFLLLLTPSLSISSKWLDGGSIMDYIYCSIHVSMSIDYLALYSEKLQRNPNFISCTFLSLVSHYYPSVIVKISWQTVVWLTNRKRNFTLKSQGNFT